MHRANEGDSEIDLQANKGDSERRINSSTTVWSSKTINRTGKLGLYTKPSWSLYQQTIHVRLDHVSNYEVDEDGRHAAPIHVHVHGIVGKRSLAGNILCLPRERSANKPGHGMDTI